METHFDNIWEEEIYSQGRNIARYPYDNIVSFIYRNYPRDKNRNEIRILEVGCGTGNNLWFAAKEGFSVTGIEGSETAVEYARKRFESEGLKGEFITGDFTKLPFHDNSFDLVFDRGAIVCVNFEGGNRACREVFRVLKPGGKFFFNPYSDRHTSFESGERRNDGLVINIQEGTLKNVGGLCFYGRQDIEKVLGTNWIIQHIKHKEHQDLTSSLLTIHAEWEIIAEKK